MDFFDVLVRYETDLWNHLDERLIAGGGPSLAVLEALRVIVASPGSARVVELQQGLSITVGAASKLADRLERSGMIVRRPHPTDRRSSVLDPTDAGIAAHRLGTEILGAALSRHLDSADADVASMAAALRTLSRDLASEGAR